MSNKIDGLTSSSSEALSIVVVDFEEMSDRDFSKELDNLRTAVEQVNELPEEILEDPKVEEIRSLVRLSSANNRCRRNHFGRTDAGHCRES